MMEKDWQVWEIFGNGQCIFMASLLPRSFHGSASIAAEKPHPPSISPIKEGAVFHFLFKLFIYHINN